LQPSDYIRSRQAREMRRAARHSYRMGRALNWQVTIDYGWQEIGDELKPSRLHRDIRKRVWSWWDYKRKKGEVTGPLYDWTTWEAPNGKHHANWLLFIPDELIEEAETVILNRSEKVLGELSSDTVHQQPIYNLNGIVDYSLKGTEPEYAEKVDIDHEPQGTIWCRRAVPSRALGRAARDNDWRTGAVVNSNPRSGLIPPRELRVIQREQRLSATKEGAV